MQNKVSGPVSWSQNEKAIMSIWVTVQCKRLITFIFFLVPEVTENKMKEIKNSKNTAFIGINETLIIKLYK